MIHELPDENLRYTIWRALHPGDPTWHMMLWIRPQWFEYRKLIGSTADSPSACQDEFTDWLCAKYDVVRLG